MLWNTAHPLEKGIQRQGCYQDTQVPEGCFECKPQEEFSQSTKKYT